MEMHLMQHQIKLGPLHPEKPSNNQFTTEYCLLSVIPDNATLESLSTPFYLTLLFSVKFAVFHVLLPYSKLLLFPSPISILNFTSSFLFNSILALHHFMNICWLRGSCPHKSLAHFSSPFCLFKQPWLVSS